MKNQVSNLSVCLQNQCSSRLISDVNKHNNGHRLCYWNQFLEICKNYESTIPKKVSAVKELFRELKYQYQKRLISIQSTILQKLNSFSQLLTTPPIQQLPISYLVDDLNNNNTINVIDNKLKILRKHLSQLSQLESTLDQSPDYLNDPPFKFSLNNKNDNLIVSKMGYRIKRELSHHHGQSLYGVVNRPLQTNGCTKIMFKILHQKKRFMYFGLCDLQQFQKHKFEGSIYKKGKGTYGIHQNRQQGKSATSIHNSIQAFSDKQSVGWDFRQGDQISIELTEDKQQLKGVFIWNNCLIFEMPLDSQSQRYYPFIGMKFSGDQIAIVDKSNNYRNDCFN